MPYFSFRIILPLCIFDRSLYFSIAIIRVIDLLTFDGAPGGTGMSPWPMMEEWGIPTFYLQSLVYEFAEKLSKKGARVPDLAIAGGFSSEDGIGCVSWPCSNDPRNGG
jgi:hypothetical protein